jgi:hypothetical protein
LLALYENAKLSKTFATLTLKNNISEKNIKELRELKITPSRKGEVTVDSPIGSDQDKKIRIGTSFEFHFNPFEHETTQSNP